MATKITKAEMTEKLIGRGVEETEFSEMNATDLKVFYDEKKNEFDPDVENEVSEGMVKVNVIQGTIYGAKPGEEVIIPLDIAKGYGDEYVEILK